jgi:hypothetical protein
MKKAQISAGMCSLLIASLGGCVKGLVPVPVEKALKEKDKNC